MPSPGPTPGPTPRPALPAAVSALVADVVHGPPVDATVIGAHRYALYLAVGGSVLPVVTSDAVPLPTAVRLAVPSGSVAWGVEAGRLVRVGGGRVVLSGLDVVAARTWRPARVHRPGLSRVGCSNGGQGSHPGTQLELSGPGADSGWLADGIRAVCPAVGCSGGRPGSHLGTQLGLEGAAQGATGLDPEWLATGIRAACSPAPPPRGECASGGQGDHFRTHGDAVAALVGRGPGLTPSGDDALAGALLVAHALGVAPHLAPAVRARLGATTAVSAALLDTAANGFAAQPVVALVDAAVAADPDAVSRTLPDVLAIGHTSGRDTVAGIRAALEALTTCRECGDGRQESHFRTHGEKTTNERSAA